MLWIDYRERGSGVIEALKSRMIDFEIRSLSVGDYIVDETIFIERKTSRDFIVSLKTGRLFKQISELKKNGKRQLLIIEGIPLSLTSGASHRAIMGALISITVSWQLPVIFSECPMETAAILSRIQKQIIKRIQKIPRKKYLKKKADKKILQKRQILESLPMIGPVLAEELIAHFGSLEAIFNATEKKLREIRGIGKEKSKNIKNLLKEQKTQYKYKTIFTDGKN